MSARIWQDPTHMPIGHGELCPCCQTATLVSVGGTRFECEGCSSYDLEQGLKETETVKQAALLPSTVKTGAPHG